MFRYYILILGWLLTAVYSDIAIAAQESKAIDLNQWGKLPIADAGRIKPLSVFAREQLHLFSGEYRWRKQPAIYWLADMIFKPNEMEHIRLFKVESDSLRQSLSLPSQADHLYSLQQLRIALRKELPAILEIILRIERKQPVTSWQEQLVELYTNFQRFQQLQDSLRFMLPITGSNNEENAPAYDELYKQGQKELSKLPKLERQRFLQIEERGRLSRIMAIIPSPWAEDDDWYSPWAMRFNGKSSPQTVEYVELWKIMMEAYRQQRKTQWMEAVEKAQLLVYQLGGDQYHPIKLLLEEWYYRLSLITAAISSYVFCILGAVVFLVRKRLNEASTWYKFIYRAPVIVGIICHAMALMVRVIILNRPPVSNLYESILFVSLLTIGAGLVVGWQKQKMWLIMTSAGMAALLLTISQQLIIGQEQLPVVMAVLNTDFWLATHVICITSGYAACIVVGITAHYALWSRESKAAISFQVMVVVALLLTAIGTLLGGIWADQSWGRFWGWDPKENGALLIVLWLVWLLHGRITGQLTEKAYLAGLAFLTVIVSLAWFGVNLLSVGLHSYGFTEGTAGLLFAFILMEISVITWLYYRQERIPKKG